jgi:hypothetical protein
MAHCMIIIEITDFSPKNFNFDPFSFMFRADTRDFEEEINV